MCKGESALEKPTRGIDHVGVTVPDVEEATDFFKNVFDAKVAYDNQKPHEEPLAGPDTEQTLGLKKGAKVIHIHILAIGSSGNIELFKYGDTEQREPAIASDLGVQHFAIYVDDIDEVAKRFVDAGGELLTEPEDFLGSIESGTGRFLYARTPWGMLIELLSYDPDKLDYPEDSETERFTP